jgi:hypothetical protein
VNLPRISINTKGMTHRYIILPRLIFIAFFLSRLVLEFLNIFTFYKFKQKRRSITKLCLESGTKGWELIDYKELLWSATEFLGHEQIAKIEIDKSKSYISQVKIAIRLNKPTHYMYDARTGDQRWFQGLIQAFRIAFIYQLNGIVPICILTDLPVRTWRTQCSVVSAKRGVVVTLMSPKDIHPIFPHRRIIGPMTMPFSHKTGSMLKRLQEVKELNTKPNIVFTGSLYEPRTTTLNEINRGLKKKGLEIEMKGRNLGSTRFSDEEYWLRLVNASIVITTSSQISSPQTDWSHLPHLIYRYIEVPAAGSLLIAPVVPSIERFFKPGEHFVSFDSTDEAVEKIAYYLENTIERERITKQGYTKAHSIINSNLYWASIDIALGKFSML